MSKMRMVLALIIMQAMAFGAEANVLGNMQTFAPNPDSLIFNNIHSSHTLEKNYFNVGIFAAYVRNELSVYDNLTMPRFVEYKDQAATFDLIFAWGITRYLEVTYSVPGYFSQSPDSGQTRQNYISSGVNGHRVGFKYNLSKASTGGFAIAGSADMTQTEDNPYIGNNVAPIWNGELIYDKRNQSTGYGFNLGYRKRNPGSPANNAYFLPVSDQLIASAAYVWGLGTNWRMHLETFGSYAMKKDNHPDQTYISSVEVLLGGKRRLARNLWGHFGGTAEALPKGLAPDFRLYAGINYFFGFEGKDKDVAAMSTLDVQPAEINLAQQDKQTMTVSGGTPPYNYELTKRLGQFDQDILEYTAGNQAGNEELIVRDSDGGRVDVPVTVRDRSAMSIIPSDATVYTGGVVMFSVNGGKAPYRTSLSPANFGGITKLRYIAPVRDGEVEVTVRDQNGQTAVARVHVVPIPKSAKEVVLKNLNFDFDTDRLTKSSRKELDRNIAEIADVKIRKIIVVGHTDSKGSDAYNQDLSQQRAETVAKILRTRFNLRTDQVDAVGYGESQPIATNETDAGRLQNRRCELKLYYAD